MQQTIDDYILDHTDSEDEYLHALYRSAFIHQMNPRMSSGHLQGRFLKMLVEMIHPHRILEIGTYVGYSALCMAEGLSDEGQITTIEINDELEDFTSSWIKGSPVGHRVKLIIGDAIEIIPQMGEMYDLVFIDGDKRQYTQYYELALRYTHPGAFIIADNTLWDCHVIDKEYLSDPQTKAIVRFNDLVARDCNVEKIILPLRDGLTIIKKKY